LIASESSIEEESLASEYLVENELILSESSFEEESVLSESLIEGEPFA
jgi:hypothetical protein